MKLFKNLTMKMEKKKKKKKKEFYFMKDWCQK